MEYDSEIVDEVVLALLYLNAFEDQYGVRAWKSLNWDALDRLKEKGFISDPQSKSKSISLSNEGLQIAEFMFEKYFAI